MTLTATQEMIFLDAIRDGMTVQEASNALDYDWCIVQSALDDVDFRTVVLYASIEGRNNKGY
jgi:hypothetical protein